MTFYLFNNRINDRHCITLFNPEIFYLYYNFDDVIIINQYRNKQCSRMNDQPCDFLNRIVKESFQVGKLTNYKFCKGIIAQIVDRV